MDADLVNINYYPPADELTLFFGGQPVPSVCDPLDGPGVDDVAVMVGINADETGTEEVVGIQVMPMLLGAVRDRPQWAALAWAALAGELGKETLREELPGFVAEVAEAFERYWRPAPPMEEQLAAIERARGNRVAEET